ncbi:MAG: lipid-binding SYLF domain-containing protein [Alphaproteobacteria bacterium]|nr:lipid-binding SYLF domain-containing protein [Alphaproteobacteria bacterium]MBV9694035.1 lipid-binding SYLF domain-containing protein [Alphaproteobacteria bacterium]
MRYAIRSAALGLAAALSLTAVQAQGGDDQSSSNAPRAMNDTSRDSRDMDRGSARAAEQSDLVMRASRVAEHMRSDPAFGAARQMLGNARAILIVPSLVKGGFVFGAEGGNGVLLVRNGRGWSAPAFYSMGSASFGLQIGLEKAEVVLLIMSDRALRGIESGNFKIGGGAGITAVTLSSGAEASTTARGGDIVAWTSATGAYGGLTLNGSVIKPRPEWNEAYYGHPVTVSEITAGRVRDPGGRTIIAALEH